MFENIFALLVLGCFIWFGIAKIVEFYKFNKNLKKLREEDAIYNTKARECQEYIYEKFNINRSKNTSYIRVMEALQYMSERDFWIPKKTETTKDWIDNLEIVCSVYREVFSYYESDEYQLLLKYRTGARVADHLLLPKKIKDDVKRKCEELGVSVY